MKAWTAGAPPAARLEGTKALLAAVSGSGAVLPGARGVWSFPACTGSPAAPLTLARVPSTGAVSTVSSTFCFAVSTAAASAATTACWLAMVFGRRFVWAVRASSALVSAAWASSTARLPATWSAACFWRSARSTVWSCSTRELSWLTS